MASTNTQNRNREDWNQRRLPTGYQADDEVLPGVRYGRPDELLSPAYWVVRCEVSHVSEIDFVNRHGSLREEVGFCLLGGYGVTLEVAETFFRVLNANRVFDENYEYSEAFIQDILNTPEPVRGRPHRYRFPKQRAKRLHDAMRRLSEVKLGLEDAVEFRNAIQSLEGVGPKTASWIARNWLDTDQVAILDIHVLRAGWAINLFRRNCKLPKDYGELERRFLAFAENINVRASILDAVIWSDMRKFGSRLAQEINLIPA